MNIELKIDELNSLEYYLAITLLGTLTALSERSISIDDSELLIFRPTTAMGAEKIGINPRLVHLLWLGTELEDVESLLPEELQKTIIEMKNETLLLLNEMTLIGDPITSFLVSLKGENHIIFNYHPEGEILPLEESE